MVIGVEVTPAQPLPFREIPKQRMAGKLESAGLSNECLKGDGQARFVAGKFSGFGTGDELIHFRPGGKAVRPGHWGVQSYPSGYCASEQGNIFRCGLCAHGETKRIIQVA